MCATTRSFPSLQDQGLVRITVTARKATDSSLSRLSQFPNLELNSGVAMRCQQFWGLGAPFGLKCQYFRLRSRAPPPHARSSAPTSWRLRPRVPTGRAFRSPLKATPSRSSEHGSRVDLHQRSSCGCLSGRKGCLATPNHKADHIPSQAPEHDEEDLAASGLDAGAVASEFAHTAHMRARIGRSLLALPWSRCWRCAARAWRDRKRSAMEHRRRVALTPLREPFRQPALDFLVPEHRVLALEDPQDRGALALLRHQGHRNRAGEADGMRRSERGISSVPLHANGLARRERRGQAQMLSPSDLLLQVELPDAATICSGRVAA